MLNRAKQSANPSVNISPSLAQLDYSRLNGQAKDFGQLARLGWKLCELPFKKPSTINFVRAMRVYERMEFICGELERKNIPPEFMQQANQLTNDGARRILLRFVPYEQEIEKQIGFLQREFENIKSAVACARKFPAIISTAMFVLVVNMAMEISFVVRFATILSTLAWFHSDSLINTCTEALERFRQLKPGDKEATSQ